MIIMLVVRVLQSNSLIDDAYEQTIGHKNKHVQDKIDAVGREPEEKRKRY